MILSSDTTTGIFDGLDTSDSVIMHILSGLASPVQSSPLVPLSLCLPVSPYQIPGALEDDIIC